MSLANFVAEFTNLPENEDLSRTWTWVIYIDSSSMRKHGGDGVVVITPDAEELCSSLKLEFKTTSNEVKYEAKISRLNMALEMGAKFVEVQSNSQVIVGHIQGEFVAKGEKMKLYLSKVHNMQASFQRFCIVKIPREDNEKADHLAWVTSAKK